MINITEESITVIIRDGYFSSTAELSSVPTSFIQEIISDAQSNETWFFFNRLVVPKHFKRERLWRSTNDIIG